MMSKKPQAKYKKAPQAPRRFKSSYMFFSTYKHRKIREELEGKGDSTKLSTTDVAKMVSQAWKDMSPEDREEWEEMARLDKARFEMEKSSYTGPWKVPASKRSQKDPNAPKRPMSAFLSFSNSKRSSVRSSHPGIGNAEVSRMLAQMWKDASDEERKDHIDKEFKLRQEYKVAIAKWRKNSENEMAAARKEREDDAIKAVLSGKKTMDKTDGHHTEGKSSQNSAVAAAASASGDNSPAQGFAYGYPGAGENPMSGATLPYHPYYPQGYGYMGPSNEGNNPRGYDHSYPYPPPHAGYYDQRPPSHYDSYFPPAAPPGHPQYPPASYYDMNPQHGSETLHHAASMNQQHQSYEGTLPYYQHQGQDRDSSENSHAGHYPPPNPYGYQPPYQG